MPTTQYPASISLASLDGKAGFVISPDQILSSTEVSVSNIGDINADGIADIIIGEPGSASGHVIFGKPGIGSSGTLLLSSLKGSDGFVLPGPQVDNNPWIGVSGAADFNGDGIDDFIIGVPRASSDAGCSYVVFGKPGIGSSGSLALSSLNGSNGFVITGEAASFSGRSVSSAGDINGDGIADLLIGAPSFGGGHAGASYVVFGKPNIGSSGTVALSSLNGSDGFKLPGVDINDQSGRSISNIGDINGDGIADIIIGVPQASSNAGTSYVVFGKLGIGSNGTLALSSLNGSNGFSLPGVAGSASGVSVSSAGDINGDGIADLIIGAPVGAGGASYVVFGKPNIGSSGTLALSSLNGSNGFAVLGVAAGDQCGTSVSSAGDINGDGIMDIVISSAADTSYVVFGKHDIGSSGTLALSGLTGAEGFAVTGSSSIASGAGDINEDGIADIIFSSPTASNLAGSVFVVFGGALSSLSTNSLVIEQGSAHIFNGNNLNATCLGYPAKDVAIVFTISDLQHGQFVSLSNPAKILSSFTQQEVRSGSIEFQHDNSLFAPSYGVTTSCGGLSTMAPQAADITVIPAPATNNTLRNSIIGATTSGVVGLGFLGLKLCLTRAATQSLYKTLEGKETDIEKEQLAFRKEVIQPIANMVFEQVGTTGLMGYRSEESTKKYVAAIESIIDKIAKLGVNLDMKSMTPVERNALFKEVAKQTKKQTQSNESCCSTKRACSFFSATVSPEEIESKAAEIAKAVRAALGAKEAKVTTDGKQHLAVVIS